MFLDDDFEEQVGGAIDAGRDMNDTPSGTSSEGYDLCQDRLDPFDIGNPESAYFFLSDDAQEEIKSARERNMKCLSCGRRFSGKLFDSCPECDSFHTEEIV